MSIQSWAQVQGVRRAPVVARTAVRQQLEVWRSIVVDPSLLQPRVEQEVDHALVQLGTDAGLVFAQDP